MKIIGIDLGSTLSEVAVFENGKPVVIVNEEGSRTTPSVINIKNGERKVGAAAKRQAVVNPKNTVILIKRFMGGTYDEVKDNISHIQYDVVNVGGYPRVRIEDKDYTPEELSAMILSKMKKTAEDYLGETVSDAIITVPAYFNDAQRQATKKAGEIAGLNVRRIIAEPTAAILASGIDKNKGGKFMVVDYGGSTLDFSVADIADNVVEILSSYGDVYCGGSDLDKIVTDWIVSEFKSNTGTDLSKDEVAMARIVEAAEKAKVELSNSTTTEINLPYITVVDNVPQHLNLTLTKAKFENMISKEIDKVMNCGKEAMKKANLNNSDLDGILLVGGSTRIPYVQEQLKKNFGAELIKNTNPDEAVALGACIQGAVLNAEKDDIVLLDVTPLSLGIETMGGVMTKIVDANTTIPVKKSQIFTTAEDNQPAVTIAVFQGERPMARDNRNIGMFTLDGILPARRGTVQIEVTFDIDANGIVHVSAKDQATGNEQKVSITASTNLSEDDINEAIKDAEAHAAEDQKRRKEVELKNEAESIVYTSQDTLEKLGDKISAEEKSKVEAEIENVKKALETNNTEEIEAAKEKLTKSFYELSEKLYKESGAQAQGGAETTSDDVKEGTVYDADYKVEDDDNDDNN